MKRYKERTRRPDPTLPPYPVPEGRNGEQACAGADTDLFFPDPGKGQQAAVDKARAICNRCEFRDPCLAYATARPDVFGTWGGATWEQRAALRRGGAA